MLDVKRRRRPPPEALAARVDLSIEEWRNLGRSISTALRLAGDAARGLDLAREQLNAYQRELRAVARLAGTRSAVADERGR